MKNPKWKLMEDWSCPNGIRWEIRTRRFGAGVPHGQCQIVSVHPTDEMGLFFVSPDGSEQFLYSYFIGVPDGPKNGERHIGELHETADRQCDVPILRRRPPEGTGVSVLGVGEGVVSSWCIHVNEWDGPSWECQTRDDFSAFVIDLDDGVRIVRFPEQVRIMDAR